MTRRLGHPARLMPRRLGGEHDRGDHSGPLHVLGRSARARWGRADEKRVLADWLGASVARRRTAWSGVNGQARASKVISSGGPCPPGREMGLLITRRPNCVKAAGVVSIVVSIHPDKVQHAQLVIRADRASCHSETDRISDF